MKITTLLSYIAALALAVFIAGVFLVPNTLAAGAIFIALVSVLIVARDYAPRNSLLVTTSSPVRASARQPGASSPLHLNARRSRNSKERVALVS